METYCNTIGHMLFGGVIGILLGVFLTLMFGTKEDSDDPR